MFDFMKKKKEEEVVRPAPSETSVPVKKPTIVNPDDFFADLERKPKSRSQKQEAEVAPPVVTGLREQPLAAAPDTLSGISTESIDTSGLKEKDPYVDESVVYGDLAVIDSSAIDTSGLADEK